MTDFGQPPGGGHPPGGGFGAPPGGQPPGGGFGAPPGGQPPGGGFGAAPDGPPGGFSPPAGGMSEGPPQFETLSIVSVVTGAIGIFSCCCCFALPLPIAAIITGALGLNKINENPESLKGKELAYIGIALGALAVLITIAMVIFNIVSGGGSFGQPAWRQFK